MRSSIRPDEFAKYAPRWVREGKLKPRQGKGLPPAAQLTAESAEPPWRGPSPFEDGAGTEHDRPFDGDVRHWRANQAQPHLTHQLPMPTQTAGLQMGLAEKLLRGSAIIVFGVIAV